MIDRKSLAAALETLVLMPSTEQWDAGRIVIAAARERLAQLEADALIEKGEPA